MRVPIRRAVVGLVLALLAGACAGSDGVSIEPLAGGSEGEVLSSCEPAGEQETTTLVEAGGELPPVATMEEAIAGNPDDAFVIEQRQDEGASYEDALHEMYGQAVGQELFADAQQLAGFVAGAYARPEAGEPFRLSFSGPVPDQLDPDAYDLGSFGLEVTSGAAGFDQEAFAAAFEAAGEVGMQTVSGSGDETAGTGRIEVIDATPDQVASWEEAVDDPSRWCLVRAPRTVACDDDVVAEARQRADRQGEVLPNEQRDGEPTVERAEQVRLSYLGLTLAEAEDKATQEGRAVRVTTRDGVQLGSNDDLQPGRLSLTVCNNIVVDTLMDLEPAR
ncbi:MAG: hypothetical protein R6U94_09435 [Nitriliruptoraceae bacterium]